jgi:hypothetical protein
MSNLGTNGWHSWRYALPLAPLALVCCAQATQGWQRADVGRTSSLRPAPPEQSVSVDVAVDLRRIAVPEMSEGWLENVADLELRAAGFDVSSVFAGDPRPRLNFVVSLAKAPGSDAVFSVRAYAVRFVRTAESEQIREYLWHWNGTIGLAPVDGINLVVASEIHKGTLAFVRAHRASFQLSDN